MRCVVDWAQKSSSSRPYGDDACEVRVLGQKLFPFWDRSDPFGRVPPTISLSLSYLPALWCIVHRCQTGPGVRILSPRCTTKFRKGQLAWPRPPGHSSLPSPFSTSFVCSVVLHSLDHDGRGFWTFDMALRLIMEHIGSWSG